MLLGFVGTEQRVPMLTWTGLDHHSNLFYLFLSPFSRMCFAGHPFLLGINLLVCVLVSAIVPDCPSTSSPPV